MGPFDDLTAVQRQQIREAHAQRKVTADDLASRTDRGDCPVCGRNMQLKKDGTLRHHAGEGRGSRYLSEREYRCKGAGQKPKEG